MEDKLDLLENKLRGFIQHTEKGKWRCNNNHNIKYFTEDEIKGITSNYDTKLGNGAFGEVYRGFLEDGRSVAVKRYIHVNSEEEFAKEVIVHSQINHKNVVRLIGCCIEKNAEMMVFEHIINGSLNDHLHSGNTLIFLKTRLNIAIECAEAIGCMHSMYNPVLHGDIKPSNILLDENFHAKISDFGTSRLLSIDKDECTVNVRGSIGYIDPAFYNEGRLTPKSDVYSFGVVLVELFTKTRPSDNEKKIVERFTRFSSKEKAVKELFDADIANVGNMKVLLGIGKIAKECLNENVDKRPEMNDVAGRLRALRTIAEQGKGKEGWKFLSESQNASKKKDQPETISVGSSSVVYKFNSLSIFNKSGPYFRNSIKVLQNIKNIMIFTKMEIMSITQNFSMLLGKGRYSEVYLGTLDDNTRVAVKRSIKTNECFREMAVNELTIHTQMHHRNILRILGCCPEMDVPILVYEYAPKGSLSKYLSMNAENIEDSSPDWLDNRKVLDLNTRYRIALGVARTMVYLHEERREWVLHCDIKPENILLDAHFCPKVSDFGLSKMTNREETMTFNSVHGSCGYMAPEWFIHRAPITAKADVYSFGMVLLEIISRRRNYEFLQETVASDEWYFPKWVYEKFYVERRVEDILDEQIIQEEAYGDAKSMAMVGRMVATAIWCLQDCADMRPSMSKVIKMLEGTVDITEPAKPIIFCIEEI